MYKNKLMEANWENYFAANKELWNKRTAVHIDSTFYDVDSFKKGASTLNNIELNELGGVHNKTLLHLQCHFGLDSMSWSRLGATVTGVDISDVAIAKAKEINAELGLDAKFICSDIYSLGSSSPSPQGKVGMGLGEALGLFDIVFTSYGTIGWLPDLKKWATVIAAYLKPGGLFYMVDFHPALWMYNDDFSALAYSYFNKEVIETNSNTYTENSKEALGAEYGWNHSISDILNALLEKGLQLQFFNEYDYSPYNCFANTVEVDKGKWQIKGFEGKLPMLYSLRMTK